MDERIYFWELVGLAAWLGSVVFLVGASLQVLLLRRKRPNRGRWWHALVVVVTQIAALFLSLVVWAFWPGAAGDIMPAGPLFLPAVVSELAVLGPIWLILARRRGPSTFQGQ